MTVSFELKAPRSDSDLSMPPSREASNVRVSPDLVQLFMAYSLQSPGKLTIDELKSLVLQEKLMELTPSNEERLLETFVDVDTDQDNCLTVEEFAAAADRLFPAAIPKATARPSFPAAAAAAVPSEPVRSTDRLRRLFMEACHSAKQQSNPGKGMDNVQFARFCRESGLSRMPGVDSTTIDIIFVKVRGRTERRIGFAQFIAAMDVLAARVGQSLEMLVEKMPASLAPPGQALLKEVMREIAWCADKSATNVFARLASKDTSAQRSSPEKRVAHEGTRHAPLEARDSCVTMATEAAGDLDRDMSVSTHALDGPLDPETKEALHIVFETFAAFGVPRTALDEGPLGMDSSQFRRLMVDSKLLHAELASSDVDLAFLKAGKARGVRKLRFGAFLAALQTLAPKSRSHMSYVDLATRLSSMLGPDMTGLTTPDAVRLHDDKSTYTGLAARIAYSASYGVGVDA